MSSTPTVLVTGGAGYIGSHTVVELHKAGYRPVIVDNFSNSKRGIISRIEDLCTVKVPYHEVDCRDLEGLQRVFEESGPVQAVIHFAAFKAVGESVADPISYYDNNIGSLLTLMKLQAMGYFRDLVFSSSCTVYGQPEVLPVTEDSPVQIAASPYGYTKQVCEQMIADTVAADRGLRSYILRYFNPIGAHPSGRIGELPQGVPNNLVPYITQSAAGLRGPLQVFGTDYNTPDGTPLRDYIHVLDLANAHIAALEAIKRSPLKNTLLVSNVGTGKGSSVMEVIRSFERASGTTFSYTISPRRPGDVEAIWAGNAPGRELPNWSPKFGLDDAMRDAWRWQTMLAQDPI